MADTCQPRACNLLHILSIVAFPLNLICNLGSLFYLQSCTMYKFFHQVQECSRGHIIHMYQDQSRNFDSICLDMRYRHVLKDSALRHKQDYRASEHHRREEPWKEQDLELLLPRFCFGVSPLLSFQKPVALFSYHEQVKLKLRRPINKSKVIWASKPNSKRMN